MDSVEREVSALQYPEGLHVAGSVVGLAIPIAVRRLPVDGPALLASPLAAFVGFVLGGIVGYLVGFWYKQRVIRRRRREAARGTDASDREDPAVGEADATE